MNIGIKPFLIPIDSPESERLERQLLQPVQADWAAELEANGFPTFRLDDQAEAEIGHDVERHWPAGLQEEVAHALFLAARMLSPLYGLETYKDREWEIPAWAAEAGHALDRADGVEAMRNAHYRLKPLIGGQTLHMSQAWDGVCRRPH